MRNIAWLLVVSLQSRCSEPLPPDPARIWMTGGRCRMRQPMIVLAAAFATLTTLAVAACTNPQLAALSQMPSPVPQPTPPPAPPPTQISVWQNVEGTLTTAHPPTPMS